MNKIEWQKYHGFSDQDIEEICQLKDGSNGTIIEVSEVPRNAQGDRIPFAERPYKGRTLLEVWPSWTRKGETK